MELLEGRVEYRLNPHDRVATKEEIMAGLSGCTGLLCLLTDTIDADIMDSVPLKIISDHAMGFNNVDIAAATERGIMVTNTPGILSESSADLAFALLLAAARRVVEGDKLVRADKFVGWDPMLMLGTDVNGKTLGVIGAGSIGTEVLKRATGFDMTLLYHNRNRSDKAEALGAEYVELKTLLEQSDFVSLHVPLTPETNNLLNRERIMSMKPGAILINTARGECIDEAALMEALRSGHIAAAGLDVYRGEPLNIDKRWYELENVVLAPHMASASLETRSKMAIMAAQNLLDGLSGTRPKNIINPEVLE
jgi:glyoxylate reductase